MIEESAEFIYLQNELLRHKYLYYVINTPEISDYDYDMLERKSFKMARDLGFRADSYQGEQDNEKHHVHWMIGYNENNFYNK